MSYTFAMISLGCAKNLMDSENMLYLLTEAGHSLVPDPEGAAFYDKQFALYRRIQAALAPIYHDL